MKSNLSVEQSKLVKVPLLNISVAAGFNNPDYETDYEFLNIPEKFINKCANPFIYKIHGDSMEPTISAGDLVIVDLDKDPKHDNIVIAGHYNDLLCKRYIHKKTFPVLKSDNPIYENIVLTENSDCKVYGVVVGKYTEL